MKQHSSFFTVMWQCVQDSILIGVLVSILLGCIVMALGNFVQALDIQDDRNTEFQNQQPDDEMKFSGSFI